MKRSKSENVRCSFCHKSQDVVGKLISSPADHERVYICDECVVVCHTILDDAGLGHAATAPLHPAQDRPSHCLMCHPMAHALLLKVEQWVLMESQNQNAESSLEAVRATARAMMGLDHL